MSFGNLVQYWYKSQVLYSPIRNEEHFSKFKGDRLKIVDVELRSPQLVIEILQVILVHPTNCQNRRASCPSH
jgi:hypothetical protein